MATECHECVSFNTKWNVGVNVLQLMTSKNEMSAFSKKRQYFN